MITEAELRDGLGLLVEEAHRVADPLNDAMHEFSIRAPQEVAAFVAQTAHESARFTREREQTYYSSVDRILMVFGSRFESREDAARYVRAPEALANRVYASRLGNGDEASGDGWRFRGGGWIQLTGREAYSRCGKALSIDLVGRPDQITNPIVAARSAAWFWVDSGCQAVMQQGTGTFERTTRLINGPAMLGAIERRQLYQQLLRQLT